jgi:hypothetical protein
MADASVSIGGDASGAIAACAAAQGAIDALHGKTVKVDIETGGGAGGGGLAGATRDMRDFGQAADRAGRSARGMGDDLGRSAGHMGRMAGDAGKLRDHLESVDRIMRGGGSSGVERSSASMRELGGHADAARDSIGGIGIESSRSFGAIESGASRASGGMRELGSGAESASRFMAGTSGAAQRVSKDLVPMAQGADGVYRSVARMAGASSDVEKFAGSMRTIDAVGRTIDGGGGSGGGGGIGGLLGKLGGLPSVAMPSTHALMGVGLAGGVAALGMGALTAAVAGVGLAGVAEDFAHNSQLMHAGTQDLRAFNREFSAMKGATSAAAGPEMGGLKSSITGVGHELAQLGAQNMAPALHDISSLGNQATAAMQKLAPSIAPAMQGVTSLAGAVIGAFGDSGPAVTSFANNITSHAPQIQAGLNSIVNVAAGLGNMAVDAVSAFGTVDNAVQNIVQPGGKPGADLAGNTIKNNMDKMLGARRDPSTGGVSSLGHWGDYDFNTGAPKPGSPAAAGYAKSQAVGVGDSGSGVVAPVKQGDFDPSKPFSGMKPDGQGGFTTGTEDTSKSKGRPPGPSHDADWAKGMTGAQALTAERARIGLPAVGQPTYGGLGAPPPGVGQPLPGAAPPASQRGEFIGPRAPATANFGSGVRPVPASMAPSLGMGSIAPLNDLNQAMQSQIAGGGAQTGSAMVQHIQKAVQTASPAASAGGSSLGSSVNSGMAQGTQSSQSVVDTVIIKHSKHIIDLAAGVLGIHSPSDEFDYLGRMTWAGFGRGAERAAAGTFGSMSGSMGGVLSAAQDMAQKNAPGYDGASGETVSVKKPSYEDYQAAQQAQQDAADRKASFGTQQGQYKPGSEGWWSAHDNRAGQLQAGREAGQRQAIGGMTHDERATQLRQGIADRHEAALARLGVQGHVDPRKDPNSAMNNVNPFVGTGRDPVQAAANKAAGRYLGMYNQVGQLPEMFNRAGQNSTLGLAGGLTAHIPKIQAAGASLAGAAQAGHKKKERSASPSQVWAEMGGNSVAGLVGGMSDGARDAAGAARDLAGGMHDAWDKETKQHPFQPQVYYGGGSGAMGGGGGGGSGGGGGGSGGGGGGGNGLIGGLVQPVQDANGWLSDRGLTAGYAWAQNVITGASSEIKKADYQALGLPHLNQAAEVALAATGLLSAGSGAESYKTGGNAPGLVTLDPASSGAGKTFVIQHQIDISGQMTNIATKVTLDMFSNVADVIPLQQAA